SAMPISEAYRRCPDAVFLYPRMERYVEVSDSIMDVFSRYSPCVEPLSLDEAFLDCSNMERLMGDARMIASRLKGDILRETGLTCSVGASAVKSVAKIASDLNKPDGLTICAPGTEREFLAPLPVECLWGVGKKTRDILHSYGITQIRDISSLECDAMVTLFGKNGAHLWYLSNGLDSRNVSGTADEQKSISEEVTFDEDHSNTGVVYQLMKRMCDSLTHELHRMRRSARTVTVKVRYGSFDTVTRGHTLETPSCSFHTLHDSARRSLQNIGLSGRNIRLIGVSFSQLTDQRLERQCDLFENVLAQKEIIGEELYKTLRNRYGKKICRASLLTAASRDVPDRR
ncbi:MAG: DNA polymerase IV, partial [Spirochaetota bacterium]